MVPSASALRLDNTTDWYWCGWVYCPSTIPTYSILLAKRETTTLEYQLNVTSGGALQGQMGPISPVVATKASGFTPDVWHFVEFWHTTADKTLHVDIDRSGTPGTANTASAGLKDTKPLNVGQDAGGGGAIFHKGLIQNLALYSYIPPDAIRDGLFGGITPY